MVGSPSSGSLMIRWFTLPLHYLRRKPLAVLLSILLLGLGLGTVIFLMLAFAQLQSKFMRNAQNIDLVIGAEGSPLQLILSSIYHLDSPTGNISFEEAQKLGTHPLFVKKAIPLSLGDGHKGFRIVGTTKAYADHYQAQLQEGKWWAQPGEVVIGSNVAQMLKMGDTFYGSHGVQEEENENLLHKNLAYKVTGVLKRNNSILDNLILTDLESIWEVHKDPNHNESDSTHHEEPKEITALLIEYKSIRAALTLPRLADELPNIQAASPAGELNRLFSLLGVGIEIINVFGLVLISVAGFSIFIVLLNALRERKYDLALMRSMGASPFKLFRQVIIEGLMITCLGIFTGLLLGHGSLELAGWLLHNQFQLTGIVFLWEELVVIALALGLGILASMIPAWQVYRIDIARTLSNP